MSNASELDAMRRQIAELQEQVASLEATATPGAPDDPVSRRHLLRHLGGVAVAGAGAAVGLGVRPAAANHIEGGGGGIGHNNPSAATTTITSDGNPALKVIQTTSTTDTPKTGIYAQTAGASGVGAFAAVVGDDNRVQSQVTFSTDSYGVAGLSANNTGVLGVYKARFEGGGIASGPAGVVGMAGGPDGSGVVGTSDMEEGVYGWSGSGPGVRGEGIVGLRGRGRLTDCTALHLVPASNAGPPATRAHSKGEFHVDASGELFQCKLDGTPGSWLRVGLTPLVPARICDTRTGTGNGLNSYAGQHLTATGSAGDTITIKVGGIIGIDEDTLVPFQASAAILNVTATTIGAEGFLTVYPAGSAKPLASNVNFDAPPKAPSAIPNLVVVKLGFIPPGNTGIKIFNGSAAPIDVIVDLAGYFS